MQSSPDPAAVTAAVQALAGLERLNLNPASRPPGAVDPLDSPWAVLQAAGPAALDEIEAAIAGATGTGRIALAMVVQGIDRERGDRVIATLRHDRGEAWVDTCIVGFRSVAQWARMQAPARSETAAPADLETHPGRTRGWLVAALVVAGTLTLVWLLRG
jgi:hypothetical protein